MNGSPRAIASNAERPVARLPSIVVKAGGNGIGKAADDRGKSENSRHIEVQRGRQTLAHVGSRSAFCGERARS
jgi:hypothetical protein